MNTLIKMWPKLPVKTIMSFWRSRLNALLRQNVVLRRIRVQGKRLSFETQSWDEYWEGAFMRIPSSVKRLQDAWNNHRLSGFSSQSGEALGNTYMAALQDSLKGKWSAEARNRLLSLENTTIHGAGTDEPLAAMTTNFRNPVILFRQSANGAGSHHNDTILLPLVVAGVGDDSRVFFHYRRQSLLRNTDDALLFFPRVDLSERGDSFRILQELVELLVNEWDSRIEPRAALLSDKVIVPLLPGLLKSGNPLRVLDIGSGAGLFTSRLVKRVWRSGVVERHMLDLTLMDQLEIDPERYFHEHTLAKSIANIQYINSDYSAGIHVFSNRKRPAFDLVLFLRILHNISTFHITDDADAGGRYAADPALSTYFETMVRVFPELANCLADGRAGKHCWLPERKFNHNSLVLPDGQSLITAITRIGRVVLIEDGDLQPEILSQHIESHCSDSVVMHDLSRRLRLSTNHVYVLARKGMDAHLGGDTLWRN